MYECYLLHPLPWQTFLTLYRHSASVRRIVNMLRLGYAQKVTKLSTELPLSRHYLRMACSTSMAARLLDDLFQSYQVRKNLRKIPYSALLTQWLIENDIDSLNEVVDYVLSSCST